jgi:hypothetical protein
MRLLTFIIVTLLGISPAAAQETVKPDPLLVINKFTLSSASKEARVLHYMKSVRAIQTSVVRMPAKKVRDIAEAAIYAQEQTGVDALSMIAMARMETDFRDMILINAPCKFKQRTTRCYADCGMTQHHVRGSLAYVQRECKKLAKNRKYSFLKSAEEIVSRVKWCKARPKWHKPFRRCVLNGYNMGPFYKTVRKCNRRYRCEKMRWDEQREDKDDFHRRLMACQRDRKKCRGRAGYWKQFSCFEYGARNQVRSKRTCRRCDNLRKIRTRFYNGPAKMSPLTAFLFSRISR